MINGYSFCLNKWLFDKEIKDELRLLIAISSLSAQYGYCFATNKYLADEFKTNESTISRKIKKLEEKGYLKIEYKRNGSMIIDRKIYIKELYTVIKNDNGPLSKMITAVIKNDKDNNITNKNININNNSSSDDTIFDFIENNFGRLLNPIEYEVISQWEDNELTRYAIKQAVLNSKFNVKYINTILHNYKMCGIRNVQEAEEQEKKFKKRYTKKKDELEEWLNEQN